MFVDFNRRMGVEELSRRDLELMGSWLQDLVNKVKGLTIEKGKGVQLTTSKGTTKVGPSGISYTDTGTSAAQSPTIINRSSAVPQILSKDFLKNPMVIGTAVSLAFLFLTSRKRGR